MSARDRKRIAQSFCSVFLLAMLSACGAATPLSPAPANGGTRSDGGIVGDSGIAPLDRSPGANMGQPCSLIACEDRTLVRVLTARGVPTSDVTIVVTNRNGMQVALCTRPPEGRPSINCVTTAPGTFALSVADSVLEFSVTGPVGEGRFSAVPQYQRSQPNGPGCEPVCFSNQGAQVDLRLP